MLPESDSDRGRLARIALTAVLAVLAVRALLQGKRLRGALAALGAVALGYSLVGTSELTVVDVERGEAGPESAAELHCAVCGEPIVPGERRRPDEAGEPAHEACLEAA